jgi:glycosyltransferase involved in cell wall biosynthesis
VNRPLRVGFLVYAIDARAGMQRQASQLLPRLRDLGLEVKVVTTAAPRDLPRLRGLPVPGAPELPVTRLPITRRHVFEALARTWLSSQGGVDVLLGLGWHEAVHAARISARTGAPFVVRYACSGEHGDLAALAREPKLRDLLSGAARHVCISEEIEVEAQAAGLPPERLVSIPNGVDLGAWRRQETPAALPWVSVPGQEPEVVLFVGRLARQKRVDVLLEAAARLADRRPQFRLALAGAGPLRTELLSQARSLGLRDRVAFLGVREDVLALHRASRVFVLPSEGEGMPNALLEALAAGTPSVATEVPGTLEVARHEREALLVPPGDPVALASALERLLADEALRTRLRSAGWERVAERYDVDRAAERYAATLADAASEAPTRRVGPPERAGRIVERLRDSLLGR